MKQMNISKVFELQEKVKAMQEKRKELENELKNLNDGYGKENVKEMLGRESPSFPSSLVMNPHFTVSLSDVRERKGRTAGMISVPFNPPKIKDKKHGKKVKIGRPLKFNDKSIAKRVFELHDQGLSTRKIAAKLKIEFDVEPHHNTIGNLLNSKKKTPSNGRGGRKPGSVRKYKNSKDMIKRIINCNRDSIESLV